VVGAADLRSGVKAIQVTMLENATARIEPFAPLGRFSPEVLVTVTKVDQGAPARVAFTVTDGAGQQKLCT